MSSGLLLGIGPVDVLDKNRQRPAGRPDAGDMSGCHRERPTTFPVGTRDRLDAHLVLVRKVEEVLLRGEKERHGHHDIGQAQHGQCATAAAAASSISRPVRKRSSVNGALIACGSSRAMVWAKTCPEPGVALNPPVPQPQLT